MIDRNNKLSIKRQAKLLGMSRGTVYYLTGLEQVAGLSSARATSRENVRGKPQRQRIGTMQNLVKFLN